MSLELDGARVELGALEWLFDLRLDAHSAHALVGRSGSGKSTLLNLVAGFLEPASGDVRWKGRSLVGLSPAERPVTTLFQHDNLFEHLSVADNVGLGLDPGLRLDAGQRSAIEATLADVGLEGFGSRRPAKLSGGERQRVGLARCLLRERPILLLDEPFGALDGETRAEMLALTRTVIERHRPCVLMVTHDPDDAVAIGAGVIELVDGRLVRRGAVA